jgi:hypothetical protein
MMSEDTITPNLMIAASIPLSLVEVGWKITLSAFLQSWISIFLKKQGSNLFFAANVQEAEKLIIRRR